MSIRPAYTLLLCSALRSQRRAERTLTLPLARPRDARSDLRSSSRWGTHGLALLQQHQLSRARVLHRRPKPTASIQARPPISPTRANRADAALAHAGLSRQLAFVPTSRSTATEHKEPTGRSCFSPVASDVWARVDCRPDIAEGRCPPSRGRIAVSQRREEGCGRISSSCRRCSRRQPFGARTICPACGDGRPTRFLQPSHLRPGETKSRPPPSSAIGPRVSLDAR